MKDTLGVLILEDDDAAFGCLSALLRADGARPLNDGFATGDGFVFRRAHSLNAAAPLPHDDVCLLPARLLPAWKASHRSEMPVVVLFEAGALPDEFHAGAISRMGPIVESIGHEELSAPLLRRVLRYACEKERMRLVLHHTETDLRVIEEEARAVMVAVADAVITFDRDGRYLKIAPTRRQLLIKSAALMLGRTMHDLMEREQADYFVSLIRRALDSGCTVDADYILRIDDEEKWFHASISPLPDEAVVWLARDVTQQKEAEIALRQTEERYRNLFEHAVEGIFQSTPEGHYLHVNPALARIYGYDSPAQMMQSFTDIGRQLYVDPKRRDEFVRLIEERGVLENFESQIHRKDGQIIWISENARAVCNEGRLCFYEGFIEDITARKVAEGQLLHDAMHDKLTNLPNRALFEDRLSQAMSRARRHANHLYAVLFLDLDRFKVVNDSMGHGAGDELLIVMAQRLEECLRPGDTVARLGGDEFAILLDDIGDATSADANSTEIAARIQTILARPFELNGQQVTTSASIGIALGDERYARPEELLRDADMAMYRAKSGGKARHEVFDTTMHERAVALLQMETDMRAGLERGEFRVYYQPIMTLQTGRLAGFEALVRWQHPEHGLVSPVEFIPVAEETGLIVPLGLWVLRESCRQMREWHDCAAQNVGGVPLTVSVNLSVKQFAQPDLVGQIEGVLHETGLSPRALKLEITESVLMGDAQATTDLLLRLRSLGVKLGLDDFGTGYSSLSYLHRFPLDTLKIDRSFVTRMSEERENLEIVRTIITLAQNLDMDVVAEGVETRDQLVQLRALQCKLGQGYLFARPLEARAALQMIEADAVR